MLATLCFRCTRRHCDASAQPNDIADTAIGGAVMLNVFRLYLRVAAQAVVLLLAATLVQVSLAAESSSDPAGLIRSTTQHLLASIEENRSGTAANARSTVEIADGILSPHIDYPRVARAAVGKHWKKASDEQKTRLVDAFRTLMLRAYATALAENSDAKIRVLPTRPGRKPYLATVRTRVQRKPGSPEVSVDYALHNRDGAWKVYGVTIEGVNLVTTYRSSLSTQVKRSGIEGAIDYLFNRAHASATSLGEPQG